MGPFFYNEPPLRIQNYRCRQLPTRRHGITTRNAIMDKKNIVAFFARVLELINHGVRTVVKRAGDNSKNKILRIY